MTSQSPMPEQSPHPKPRVLAIVGSLRRQSLNRQMAEYVVAQLSDRADAEILDWRDVPLFNQNDERPTPAAVTRVREQVAKSDALWIFAPEYNHGVPGPLKNLIDWLSRPLDDGSPAVIIGKTATVSGVGGSSCARYSHGELLPTFDFLQMHLVPAAFTSMSFTRTMFTTSTLDLDEANKASLENQATALLADLEKQIAKQA